MIKKRLAALCLAASLSTQACAMRGEEFSVYDSRQGQYREYETQHSSDFAASYVAPIFLGVAMVAGIGLFVWGVSNFPVSH